MLHFRLLLFIALLPLAACSDPRTSAISQFKKADIAELRTDVARLYLRLFPTAGPTIVAVRPELWTPGLIKMRPVRMNLYRDGLAITLHAEPGMDYGIHIAPSSDAPQPKSTDRTQYEKLQDGISFFAQKR